MEIKEVIDEAIISMASEIATDPTYNLKRRRFTYYVYEWFGVDYDDDSVEDYVNKNWDDIRRKIYDNIDKFNK